MNMTIKKAAEVSGSIIYSLRGLIFIAVVLFVFLGIPPHVFFMTVFNVVTSFIYETAKEFDLAAIQKWFRFMIF